MRRLFRPTVFAAFAVVLSAHLAPAADPRPMQVDDLFAFKRVAAPRLSPNGKQVAYQVGTVDLAANKSSSAIWIAEVDKQEKPKALTDPKGKKDAAPQWSPDGTQILFESNRSGSQQLWIVPAEGGEPKQLTNISTGASNGIWSPDGKSVAFVSAVYPEYSRKPFAESDKLNKARDDEREKSPVKAKVFKKLFFRHWDDYVGDKRQHLFVCGATLRTNAGEFPEPQDVTPGDRDAYSTSSTFSSGEDFTFTPDSQYLIFTAAPADDEAWSTNYDICRVKVTNTSTRWETITSGNKAADSGPKISSDGKWIGWRAQKRAGYEADKWDLVVTSIKPDGTLNGDSKTITADFGPSVDEFAWATDPVGILFLCEEKGRSQAYAWDVNGEKPFSVPLTENSGTYRGLNCAGGAQNGRSTYASSTLGSPSEVHVTGGTNFHRNVSLANADLLAELNLPKPESVDVPVEGGVKMQMWILKPPGFDPKKKWPVVYLVHGGPQGAWEDGWSYRWNPQVWAAQGYVVALPNPRGSTGFGQKYVDEISGDWGGKCYRDLVAGLDRVESLPYVDKTRIAAAGASFGGYMMNWFAVNPIAERFKCLITHCSVWNFESMWGTTDELWFDEFEHGGLPWEVPGKYREFSPHTKAANLKKYQTPMLVIHNDLDFRCPIGQGHELFTTLQRQGVPSRMVNFPDEGHWVLKPKNSQYWHKEVFSWLSEYCPAGGK